MFESIPVSKPDAILALMAAFRADERADKIDLGVGVYKDRTGATPVMRAVKSAELKLVDAQTTKTYVGPTGDATFCQAMSNLVFGENHDKSRIRSLQTPGGSGAIRVLADMLHAVDPDATTWVTDPTWPNHIPMLTQAGHKLQSYRYYDEEKNSVDFDSVMDNLSKAKPGDILLLHGCCHNPTGADLNQAQWTEIAHLCVNNDLMPFVDIAYQGFGNGLEEDAAGLRILAEHVPEMVVAASCSKNLALYRERVGAALVMGKDSDAADRALGKATMVVRSNYSMPPDHGAALTTMIFHDQALTHQWQEELDEMRGRIKTQRKALADSLRKRSNSGRFDYIEQQNGMFSRLPLSPEQIDSLRDNHGIYIVGDGRINIAGLPDDGVDELAEKIIDCIERV